MGVAISFKEYASHLLVEKISGASAGALAAVGLLCDLPLGMCKCNFLINGNSWVAKGEFATCSDWTVDSKVGRTQI